MSRWWLFAMIPFLIGMPTTVYPNSDAGPLPASSALAPTVANPYGIVEGFWFPELTCDLGVGWERIIFDWAQHQPTGPTDWHTLNVDDRWLKAANQCNREVVALLKNTPAWATSGLPGAGVPSGLYLPVDHPDNHWANFVRQAAYYYAPRGVHRFIIWNEPDIERGTYGFEYEGTLEDYAQMLKVAYIAAKQGNPAAEIHLAGKTYWHNVNDGERLYLDALLENLTQDPDAAANDHYFDAASLHIYFRSDSVYDIVTEMRGLLDGYGLTDKAIWINETNAPPTQDPAWPVERPVFQYTLEQQAAFLGHASVLALAAGAERVAVYKLYDQELPPGGETFGILRPNDQAPRPAFDAWQAVNTRLHDAISAERRVFDAPGVDLVRVQHASGDETLVAWSRTDADVSLMLTGAETDAITLPGALCNGDDPAIPCPVGGDPAFIRLRAPDVTVQAVSSGGTMRLLIDNGEWSDDE